ncbi:MAG: TIGR02147 family protein [Bdellovibrionales bacterium]|nr:TIGR02147 family protein [Bdellovibrionales bacterium]
MKKNYYIEQLKESYLEKRTKNPQLSMNGFARFLGMSPSQFNEVLNGKSGLSEAKAQRIADKLQYSELERELFCLSVVSLHSRSPKLRINARREFKKMMRDKGVQLKLETFSLVSHWYHFAILELMRLDHFQSDIHWIAQQLKLEKSTVKEALARLEALGLVKERRGQWVRQEGVVKTTQDIPSEFIKKHHSQVLEKSIQALYDIPVDRREYDSVFLAMDQELVSGLKEKIREFNLKMIREINQKSKKKDVVTCLSIQMFPVIEASLANEGE